MGRRATGAVVAALAAGGAVAALAAALPGHPQKAAVSAVSSVHPPNSILWRPESTTTTSAPPPPTTPAPATTTTTQPAAAVLAGCPVPPSPPRPAPPPPWHPSVLVPDSTLPPVVAPVAWQSSLGAISGKGMWIWLWSDTEAGNATSVVKQATAAGLHQLWVRVGDSKDGFYGAAELAALVPAAHAAGVDVVAWGFPYLYDPVGDAAWTAQILAWRGPDGRGVDAYSADLERSTEGVDMTAQRVGVYLQAVRRSAGDTPVIATVYAPLDTYWFGSYPYRTMAPYVDAFAPMVYWECTDPAGAATLALDRLTTLRPVHLIGQAFNMADVGGRQVGPSGAEIREFLAAGKQGGALGTSFWVWQTVTPEEWTSLSNYSW